MQPYSTPLQPYTTLFYPTLSYFILLYSTLFYSRLLHLIPPYSIPPYFMLLHPTLPKSILLCVVLCNSTLFYTFNPFSPYSILLSTVLNITLLCSFLGNPLLPHPTLLYSSEFFLTLLQTNSNPTQPSFCTRFTRHRTFN